MSEVDGPQDPGDKDDKPPPGVIMLSPSDLPEAVTEAITRAVSDAIADQHMVELIDHAFFIENARATGQEAKRLRMLYPQFPKWVREELIGRRMTMDAWGDIRRLH